MTFTKSILLRARIVFLFALFFVALITWKIVHLQFVEVDKWRNCAKVAQLAYRPIVATRGNIYAYDGALLATSLPFYRVALDPVVASDACFKKGIDPLSQALADFYQAHPPDYYKQQIIDARAKKKRYLLDPHRTMAAHHPCPSTIRSDRAGRPSVVVPVVLGSVVDRYDPTFWRP